MSNQIILPTGSAAKSVSSMVNQIIQGAGFLEQIETVAETVFVWLGEEPAEFHLVDMQGFVDNLRIIQAQEASTEQIRLGNLALQGLADSENTTAIVNAVENQIFSEIGGPSVEQQLQQMTDLQLDQLLAGDMLEFLGPLGANKALNRAKKGRRSNDGSRVSSEVHEWRYCWTSGAINQIFDLGAMDRPDKLSHSYSAVVGSKKMRRALQRVRLLNRCLRSRNVKKVLDVFGKTKEEFFSLLANAQGELGDIEAQCQEAGEEFMMILQAHPEN